MVKEYLKPSSVAEALEMKKNTARSFYLGGGTKLNKLKENFNAEAYISLENLGLKTIEIDKSEVHIGALVTVQQLIDSTDIPEFLKGSAAGEANRNLRNASTIGGETAYAQSSSTLVTGLIALDAEIETAESGRISLYDYVRGDHSELVLKVILKSSDAALYQNDQRVNANSRPELTVAASISRESDKVKDAIVVMGGVDNTPIRLEAVEAKLKDGSLVNADAVQDAVQDELIPYTKERDRGTYINYIGGVLAAGCVGRCMKKG